MNFDELVNMIDQMKIVGGDECLICRFPIIETEMCKLICKHTYHIDCLKSCKINTITICPYCKTSTRTIAPRYTPYTGCKAIIKAGKRKGTMCNKYHCRIHKKIESTISTVSVIPTIQVIPIIPIELIAPVIPTISIICTHIIRSGKHKGLPCNKQNCEKHLKINENLCKAVLKTGTNKGTTCGKINCKRHNNTIINTIIV